MSQSENRFRRPLKYAIYCALAGAVGYFAYTALGYTLAGGLAGTVMATAVGGFVGGLIRQKRDKDS